MAVADLKSKAKDALRRRQYDLAVEMYLEALRFEPNDRDAVEGFFQAARKVRETKGKPLFGGMFSRVSLGTNRDPRKRMDSCFRGLAKNPEDMSLLLSLGEAAGETGADETAVAAYRVATEVDADHAEAWKRLGEYQGRQGRIQEALKALGEAVRLSPRDQEAIKLRKNLAAEGALQAGRYDTAGSTRELMKDQDEARRLERETRLQLTPEHAAQEMLELESLVEADPSNSRLRIRLGDLRLHQGQEEQALVAFEQALAEEPDNFELSVRVGDMHVRKMQHEVRDCQAALDAAPGDADKTAALAKATREYQIAQKDEFARRVKAHPMDLAERFRLGQALLTLELLDEAAAEFQQTVRDPKRKTESLLLLARCFEGKKLVSLAVKKLEEALTDFPTLASPKAKDVHYAYADLLERTGEREKARQVFEKIYEVDITYRDVSQRLEALAGG